MPRLTAAVIASGVLLSFGSPARADSGAREVAARVTDQWRALGATAVALPTRFLFDEETVVVPIATGADDEQPPLPCVHVAVIGARGLSFRARLSDAPMDPLLPPEPAARASSTAGVLELRRCDGERPPVRNVVVTAEAGRGAVEVIVGRTTKLLPQLGTIIPERTGGAIPTPPEAGALPAVAAQEKRADAAEARAKRDGALAFVRASVRSVEDGSGQEELELGEGCHRIEVFGKESLRERPNRRFRLDVDAELKDGDQLLARDRTEAPDARLETCVGGTTLVSLAYAGTPPYSEVVITRGTWPLPARLPPLWGPTTRSRMGRVMFVRHVAVPADDPVLLVQGAGHAGGPTPVPFSAEPGACYVAVVGVSRGRARSLQLRAVVGARESVDERGAADEAGLAAFCVRAHESARLEVTAKGTGLSWALAVFRVKSGVWEAGR